jgi:hypothetical protein
MLADVPIVVTVRGAVGTAVTVRLAALYPVARTSEFVLPPR